MPFVAGQFDVDTVCVMVRGVKLLHSHCEKLDGSLSSVWLLAGGTQS